MLGLGLRPQIAGLGLGLESHGLGLECLALLTSLLWCGKSEGRWTFIDD